MLEVEDAKSRQHSGVVSLPLFAWGTDLARQPGKKGNSYRWSEIKLDLRSENRASSFQEEVNLPLE